MVSSMLGASNSAPVPSAPGGGGSTVLLMMVMFMILIVVMDPTIRTGLGAAVGGAFTPLLGFGGGYPIWTLFAASLVLVIFTTVVRHFFTDWVAMGRQRHVQKWVSSQYREIRLHGNVTKMKKLNELQAGMMRDSTEAMASQMKTTIVTIVVAIAIFLWLGVFMYSGTTTKVISVPWAGAVDYLKPGPFFHVMPTWILFYMLLSVPLGQVLGAALKVWSFRRKLDATQRASGGKSGTREVGR
ncbi:MAG: EMC3/TMCO1 family protein [Thermoplasmata archaeon]